MAENKETVEKIRNNKYKIVSLMGIYIFFFLILADKNKKSGVDKIKKRLN